MDNLSPAARKRCMSQIRAKETKPEMIVRSLVHRLGFRFRLHRRDLPGCPDLVLTRHKKLIFVHGCFWHMHQCRFGKVVPKSNADYWQAKREGNCRRDRKNRAALQRLRWSVLVIWECWTRDQYALQKRIERILGAYV
jgi:DNA mismatch endonuclease (patch repair protein)